MNIPATALEAGARAITMALIFAVEEDCRALALTDDERTELARAAFLAMIEAWPGAKDSGITMGKHSTRIYILPLPTEASDDQ